MVSRTCGRGRPLNAYPCQPIVVFQPPSGPGWAHELTHDGLNFRRSSLKSKTQSRELSHGRPMEHLDKIILWTARIYDSCHRPKLVESVFWKASVQYSPPSEWSVDPTGAWKVSQTTGPWHEPRRGPFLPKPIAAALLRFLIWTIEPTNFFGLKLHHI
jgi:hypothetical protein